MARRKGGRARSRATYINIRVRITDPNGMSLANARKLLRRAIITGYVPAGIEIAAVDWQNGEGAHAKSYEYIGDDAIEALIRARAILMKSPEQHRLSIVDADED